MHFLPWPVNVAVAEQHDAARGFLIVRPCTGHVEVIEPHAILLEQCRVEIITTLDGDPGSVGVRLQVRHAARVGHRLPQGFILITEEPSSSARHGASAPMREHKDVHAGESLLPHQAEVGQLNQRLNAERGG